MLYDPKWEKQDLQSIHTLIAWLETQAPERKYCFHDPENCLLAQYLKSNGLTEYREFALCAEEAKAYFGGHGEQILKGNPRTFGAALERARGLI